MIDNNNIIFNSFIYNYNVDIQYIKGKKHFFKNNEIKENYIMDFFSKIWIFIY